MRGAFRAKTAVMTELPRLVLAQGRERSLLRRHPWVFSGAVRAVRGEVPKGGTTVVCSAAGEPLAVAAYNAEARIAARVWSFEPGTLVDSAFFAARVERAIALRRACLPPSTLDACRLVHAESDGLPGVVVDRFGEQLVVQLTTAGAQRHRELLVQALCDATGLSAVYERSEGDALPLEGLSPTSGALRGPVPAACAIEEHGLGFELDVTGGQKTGFYLDQRDNRALVRELARGRDVLDAFCYGGGFAIAAARAGARSVRAVDSSEPALALAARNAERNGCGAIDFVRADVFEHFRKARDRAEQFDLIVLDPPKLAPTAATAERASRAYKDLNLLACKLLRPGGVLLTFSCSSGVSVELFQKIVASAAADAARDVAFVRRLGAGADHPVSLHFPEGEYLKGLLCLAT
jgi:23S rRNA (cytosine1962-C5)-methyltransferase